MPCRLRAFALTAAVGLAMAMSPAHAKPDDYAFQPVSVDVRGGDGSELGVRLVHKPTGKAVAGGVLFRTRQPGVYKFRADPTMAGGWAFKLVAKVPRETETVEGSVIFKAK